MRQKTTLLSPICVLSFTDAAPVSHRAEGIVVSRSQQSIAWRKEVDATRYTATMEDHLVNMYFAT